jgi:uroporphyrinogen-III synthase
VPERLPEGYGVLVTRPRGQAAELAEAVRARGGTPFVFPALEIRPREAALVRRELRSLPPADITIFISRNAVRHGLAYASGRLAAIGPTTAEEIRRLGRAVDIVPASGFDSESLLAEPAFADLAGRCVRIVRGNPGRALLATELERRGARVDAVEAYRREMPRWTDEERRELAGLWQRGGINALVIMSVESLENLARLLPAGCHPGPPGPLLVTPAARVLKEARQRFPGCPAALAAGPRASELVDCLVEHTARAETPTGPFEPPD